MVYLICGVILCLFCVFFYTTHQTRIRKKIFSHIIAKEFYIKTDHQCHLHGKPDLIALVKQLYVIDIKYRSSLRVYQSDIIQLSTYTYILRHSHYFPHQVSRYGYLLLKRNENYSGKLVKIKLLTDHEIIQLYQRYLLIKQNNSKPNYAKYKNFCQYCAYQTACDKPKI